MKKLLLIVCALLATVGAWAQTSTWESHENFTQASGGMGSFTWYGVHTPGDASQVYSLTAIQIMQLTGNGNNDNYLAIARVSATETLSASHVVAISDNHLAASQSTGTYETYNFSSGVSLLGGTTYYFVFLSSNTPTDGAYPVRQSRLALNHTDYGAYAYGNSANQANWWFGYKATVESSSATGFCTGDILGGTMESGNWKNSWTSGTSPSFTLTSSANNINNSSSKPSGGLDIRIGSAQTATYMITAPAGYLISGYKLFGNALNGNQTVTPAEGGSAVVFTNAGNSIEAKGFRKPSTSFTLAGANNGLFLHAMQVTLVPYSSITTLPTAIDKAYVIANARGIWNFADNATSMGVVSPTNINLDATAQQIALIYHESNYYLFSVNAGKYLTANNTLTSVPTEAEQVNITATGNTSYPWFFSFKNVANKNINVNNAPSVLIDSWSTIDAGNSNAVIEAADFNATDALNMFNVRTVTYNLSYGGNSTFRTVSDVKTTVSANASDFVPSSFLNDLVTLTYSPEQIASNTTEVNVTATWNGPFELSESFASAKWYTIGMHKTYETENHLMTYNTSGETLTAETAVGATEYEKITPERLFCFMGNPYDGLTIYNKAAGDGKSIFKSETQDEQATMAATGSTFIPKASSVGALTDGYFCLFINGDNNYLNCYYNADNNYNIKSWSSPDAGSTCWVEEPGQYYLDFIDNLNLDAPVGAVGTKSYFVEHPSDVNTITSLRSTIASNMTSSELSSVNTQLDPIAASNTIDLADGYYRFVNAFTSWTGTHPTTYFNSTNNRIEWSVASNTSSNVNSIFKIDATTPSIYSPNAQKYMSAISSTVSGSLANEPGTTVFTSLGAAQYNVVVGGGIMHTAGHNSGSGTSGNLTHWGGNYPNTADAWYIVQVDDIDLALNNGGDGNYYATLCLPFTVTLDGCNAYTLTLNSAKTGLTLSEPMTEVPAGTPVFLKGTSASATANIAADDAYGAPLTTTALTGTYLDQAVAGDKDYFLGKANGKVGFYHWNGTKLKANRAYIENTTSNVKGFVIDFDSADAIRSLFENAEDSDIYDLSGRRISQPKHGIFIVNGKKIIVK